MTRQSFHREVKRKLIASKDHELASWLERRAGIGRIETFYVSRLLARPDKSFACHQRNA